MHTCADGDDAERRQRTGGAGARSVRHHREDGVDPRPSGGADRARERPAAGGAGGQRAGPAAAAAPPRRESVRLVDTSVWVDICGTAMRRCARRCSMGTSSDTRSWSASSRVVRSRSETTFSRCWRRRRRRGWRRTSRRWRWDRLGGCPPARLGAPVARSLVDARSPPAGRRAATARRPLGIRWRAQRRAGRRPVEARCMKAPSFHSTDADGAAPGGPHADRCDRQWRRGVRPVRRV